MNFLVTGGCGYIGTQLTKHLLSKRNKVTIVDNCWFGNFHKKNKMLKIIKKDVRNFEDLNIKNIDTIIHLANFANDPTVELKPI
jgi:UDP-glucose 4-epimerase